MARQLRRRNHFRLPLPSRTKRPLVRLIDSGAEVQIDPALFGIEGRDRSWNRFAQSFLVANQATLSLLDVRAAFMADTNEVRLVLRPGGTVGAVPLLSPTTHKVGGALVVSPRFGWSGIGPALRQIGWSASPEILRLPSVPGSAREVPPWVLAGPIISRLAALLRNNRHTFREVIETQSTPRGQILWEQYASQELPGARWHRLPCRYTELDADEELRAYIRWGGETVRRSLLPWFRSDAICRDLLDQVSLLLSKLGDIPARLPAHTALDRLYRMGTIAGQDLRPGLEALGWLVDERGLAGTAEPDGLAWRMTMHELFERWVETIAAAWARSFGGSLRSGRRHDTLIPIRWRTGPTKSLSHLLPDLTVSGNDRIWIIDAKYKGHFEEMDEARWHSVRDELRESHRHDLHQILAYAAAHATKQVTCVLVYPMHRAVWERLEKSNSAVSLAVVETEGREISLALAGAPLDLSCEADLSMLVSSWNQSLLPQR